ncbi:aminotransferase [Bombardia bombarda]|uniref:Aminotransferase n=1 Tax=Bombardia bombarda TaxID=252184 RepID=A0AA39XLN7_9PEZI|nr:aminotransferase [Bombardia bombarda]
MASEFQIFSTLRYDPALLRVPASDMSYAGWNHVNPSPFYMLDFHRDRMLRAAAHWGWEAAEKVLRSDAGITSLSNVIMTVVGEEEKVPMRVKVTMSKEGAMEVLAAKIPKIAMGNLFPERLPVPGEEPSPGVALNLPLKAQEYEVVLDQTSTSWSEYVHFKTTKREMYDLARQRAQIGLTDRKEVLIVNKSDGSILEGSLTTPYFWRSGRWVTPVVTSDFPTKRGSGGQDGTTRRWMLERGLAFEETIMAESVVDGEECWLSNGARGFMFGRVELH